MSKVEIRIEDYGDGSKELLVSETCASYYKPGEVLTHSVWDGLAIAALALPEERRRRILMLGVGGGSCLRLLRRLCPEAELVGVELLPEVVEVARRHFALDEVEARIEIADAEELLRRGPRSDRERYDLVIEDLFIGHGEELYKPRWLPKPGHAQATSFLAEGGVLVSNCIDESPDVLAAFDDLFPNMATLLFEDCENHVVLGSYEALPDLARRASAIDWLAPTLKNLEFHYGPTPGPSAFG